MLERIREQAIQANQELEQHIEQGFRICYLDEFVISKSTIPRSDWSARRSYNRVDLWQFHKKTMQDNTAAKARPTRAPSRERALADRRA